MNGVEVVLLEFFCVFNINELDDDDVMIDVRLLFGIIFYIGIVIFLWFL